MECCKWVNTYLSIVAATEVAKEREGTSNNLDLLAAYEGFGYLEVLSTQVVMRSR